MNAGGRCLDDDSRWLEVAATCDPAQSRVPWSAVEVKTVRTGYASSRWNGSGAVSTPKPSTRCPRPQRRGRRKDCDLVAAGPLAQAQGTSVRHHKGWRMKDER